MLAGFAGGPFHPGMDRVEPAGLDLFRSRRQRAGDSDVTGSSIGARALPPAYQTETGRKPDDDGAAGASAGSGKRMPVAPCFIGLRNPIVLRLPVVTAGPILHRRDAENAEATRRKIRNPPRQLRALRGSPWKSAPLRRYAFAVCGSPDERRRASSLYMCTAALSCWTSSRRNSSWWRSFRTRARRRRSAVISVPCWGRREQAFVRCMVSACGKAA